jgi:predicted O-methyltransferase YrrM
VNEFFDFWENFEWEKWNRNPSNVAIDKCHAMLIYGFILSQKPEEVLELGVGSGLVTKTIAYALKYNKKGNLTSIDNWAEWNGQEPSHIEELRQMGVKIVAPIQEKDFILNETKKYDVIISDADHKNSGKWADKVYDLLNNGGTIFAHDVERECWSTLKEYVEIAKNKNYEFTIFNKSSLDEEYCWRGLLMAKKTSPPQML